MRTATAPLVRHDLAAPKPSSCDLRTQLTAPATPLRSSEPTRRSAYAAATGWRPGHRTFVLAHRAIGANTKNICGLPPDAHRPEPRGTSKAWLRSVGVLARKSSGMMLTTCCSFAAPLLRIANEQAFGLCLAGKTGGGKTTATLVGSSVCGAGRIDQLLTWNATLGGLEPALRSHNDCLMVVDDLNKMPVASDKEKYHSANNFAHNLATGSTKRRSPAFDDGSDNGEQYRVISLTSAETTIAELAAKCGEQRGGDARRLIDVPIYLDGLDHIFDRMPNAGTLGQSKLQQLFSAVHQVSRGPLPWSAYENPYIWLRQSKGGRRVAMPAGTPLRALLDATDRRGPLILTTHWAGPGRPMALARRGGKACERAGIDGLTFHDLRGTAVVRLAIAGASVPQIAAVTGHSLKDVEAILDAHYLGRDIQLAEAAVKLEARTKL
ncbi:DUF927 domain-containing protein [Bradyrhizobium symbiodeficiens]|uniref:DUF927 domain-containing protein n=1 Tax=Bradyrhizobium symbiodeficiens TaxID=1404367 RepID=UPI001FCE6ED8|nr:DUF927 domain-containing protein [Bradyrhizobium symbiodeficiens]